MGSSLHTRRYLVAGVSSLARPAQPVPEPGTITECVKDTLQHLQMKEPATPTVLTELVGYCYSAARSQGLLNDFAIRRLNFSQQYRANGILLWLVVGITVSGVALSAFQLWGSYRLTRRGASFTAESEISLGLDRLVLKTSITGLLLLVSSFAFFLVFVLYVYRIEYVGDEDMHLPQQTQTLPLGGLGSPPGKE